MNKNQFFRRIVSYGFFLFSVLTTFGQTSAKNYTTVYRPQVAVTNEWAVPGLSKESGQRSVTYYDALGRTSQVLLVAGSPLGFDLVTPVYYDLLGRQDRKYLPFALNTTNNGAYLTGDTTAQKNFYTALYGSTDGVRGFAKTQFEASPLNRPLKQGAPGNTWQPNTAAPSDHSVKYTYSANYANEVKRWKVVNNALTDDGYYAPSTLYRTTTWDENSQQDTTRSRTIEYKDRQGKLVQKVSFDGATRFATCYVYDDLARLRFVIPPLAAADNLVSPGEPDLLCFQYRYDTRRRMVKKKYPGLTGGH